MNLEASNKWSLDKKPIVIAGEQPRQQFDSQFKPNTIVTEGKFARWESLREENIMCWRF